jgi:hypothetical protein
LKIIAPTILLNGNDSIGILKRIPSDIRDSIVEYADIFETKTIIPLLESSESSFDKKYEEAIKEFLCNSIQIISIIYSQPNLQDYSYILKSLLDSYYSGLKEIETQISRHNHEDDPMVRPLSDAIEIARQYAALSDYFNRPIYSHALLAFANIAVSVSSLKMILKSNNVIFKVKTDNFIYKCKYYYRELNEYIKNIEMER